LIYSALKEKCIKIYLAPKHYKKPHHLVGLFYLDIEHACEVVAYGAKTHRNIPD
jgi:hypothetical protein